MDPTPYNPSAVAEPPEYRECFRCSFRGEIAQTACPQCGKKLYSARNIRVRGGIQIVSGAVLILMAIGLAGFIAYLFGYDPSAARKLAEDRAMFIAMFALFAVLGLFGLNALVMGVWQVAFGRRNKVLVWITLVLLVLILISCLSMVFVMK